jgi:NCAIR mutase (PurE)-related protein
VTNAEANQLLEQFRAGKIPRESVLRAFQAAPVADLGFAQVDTHRALRKNFPGSHFWRGQNAGAGRAKLPPSSGNTASGFWSRASPPNTPARSAKNSSWRPTIRSPAA